MGIKDFTAALCALDLSSRPKRRRALCIVLSSLERIRDEEEGYLHRMHPNFHDSDAYADAEESIGAINDALCILADAY